MSIATEIDGRVLRLVLNRPEKRNALDLATCREIVRAVTEANQNPAVGAVLLSGAGPAFCAGMDLSEAPHVNRVDLAEAHDQLFTMMQWTAKPLIAAVQGAALAGGTGLVANAHLVIAAENATFGLTEIRLGIWPVLIFPAISAAIGERRAVELSLSGRVFSASEAKDFGLVSEVVGAGELERRTAEVAASISGYSGFALRAGLDYVRQIQYQPPGLALRVGRIVRNELTGHPDFAEGVRAWAEKRKPNWPGNG